MELSRNKFRSFSLSCLVNFTFRSMFFINKIFQSINLISNSFLLPCFARRVCLVGEQNKENRNNIDGDGPKLESRLHPPV